MAKKIFETYGVELTGLQSTKFEWWLSNVNKKAPNTITKEERKQLVLDWLSKQGN